MTYLCMALSALVGFLAGLFAFRVKARWCPSCGEDTIRLAARVRAARRRNAAR
jgi:NADH pyrophosphatase NudC (nudix superfamily)